MRALTPTIAVVGAGLMGRWHARAAHRLGARIVAVIDADRARAVSLARVYNALALIDLVELPIAVDVMHLCSPANTHAELIAQAFGRGSHVVCEKPLTVTASELQHTLALARAADRKLIPVHQFPFQRGASWLQRNIETLGDIRRIEFMFCSAGTEMVAGMRPEQLVRELLPHPLSILHSLRIAVASLDWQVAATHPGEMQAMCAANGMGISLAISTSARPTRAAATIYGTRASALLDFFHGYVTLRRGNTSRADKLLRPFAESAGQSVSAAANLARRAVTGESAYPGLASLLKRFYACLGTPAPPPIDEQAIVDIYTGGFDLDHRIRLAS